MRMIEIKALENGAHRNQTGFFRAIPEGWAVIPDTIATENFPFGDVTAEEIDGIMTVTSWVGRDIPVEVKSEISPAILREKAYNTEPVIQWDSIPLTVTQASSLWIHYAAEGNEKANALSSLIASAKAAVREQYPDK